ncbi:MAG: 3-deoxy-D-manno-octulosonic acid transferase, partial [Kiritimatiellia bacterium]|nr:3-deoxy-D-manno-octulosonic acid transferase [Kiritimatiellia bacterium]
LCGPNMENFRAIVEELRRADALLQVRDRDELKSGIAELLADPDRRRALGERAAAFVASRSGTMGKTVEILLPQTP